MDDDSVGGKEAICRPRSALTNHQETVSRTLEPVNSTIVAARSRRLTGSLTVFFAALPPGGMIRSGTCSSVS